MKTPELQTIGQRIAYERRRLGMTQMELSIECDLEMNTISSLECGRRSMKITSLMKICRALHSSADYLLFGSSPGPGAN